jgi:hypothetical protein
MPEAARSVARDGGTRDAASAAGAAVLRTSLAPQ